jgi:hypothetical protein
VPNWGAAATIQKYEFAGDRIVTDGGGQSMLVAPGQQQVLQGVNDSGGLASGGGGDGDGGAVRRLRGSLEVSFCVVVLCFFVLGDLAQQPHHIIKSIL